MTTEQKLWAENERVVAENAKLRVELANCRRVCESLANRVDSQSALMSRIAERDDRRERTGMPIWVREAVTQVYQSLADWVGNKKPTLTILECRDKLRAIVTTANPRGLPHKAFQEVGGEG